MKRIPSILACCLAVLAAAGALTGPAVAQTGDDVDPTTLPNYPHGNFRADCRLCHDADSWSPANIGPDFDHGDFAQPLRGAHEGAPCLLCHITLTFAEATGTTCADCHTDVHLGEFGTECQDCHSTQSFDNRPDARRDHRATRFPLSGAHNAVECEACHNPDGGRSASYTNTPVECVGCHLPQYEAARNPDHVGGGLPTSCQDCHSDVSWSGGTFDHSLTRFPLTGAHVNATCAECHEDFVFAAQPTDCYSCHEADYVSAADPAHGGFSLDCTECHNTAAWEGALFDHSTTAFPLTGAHNTVSCTDCHVAGVYAGTPQDCFSCHEADYTGATNPDHAGFSTDCMECHNTTSWGGGDFDHDTTGFPLRGAHQTTDCFSCHEGGVFAGTPSDCYACHQPEYDATTDPDHGTAGFSTDCAACHNTVSWPDGNFDHDATAFPLTGAHNVVSCLDCHVGNVFAGTPQDCYTCHQADYDGTTDPDHLSAGFPTDCVQCHGTASWAGASFDHDATGFPLEGAHVTVSCTDCHVGGVFAGTPQDCYACHQPEYDGTTNPDHLSAGFSTDCAACHNTVSWPDGNFDHDATAFPLTGAHNTVSCLDCHVGNVFAGTPLDCYACHQPDYDGTTDPNHVSAGFPTDCVQCHGTASWAGASFDHDATGFPLEGAHVTVSCTDCHVGGIFAGTPQDCYSCHQADYDGVGDPNHLALGYSTDCLACHDMNGWEGAQIVHDFPIYSGTHRQSRWEVCSTCHENQSNFGLFTCFHCHPHSDQNGTNNDHSEVNGYSYDSPACYNCHPDGD